MFQKVRPRPDARILKLRDYEDKIKTLQNRCSDQATFGIVAKWEADTDRKIAKNAVRRELDKLRDARSAQIQARREQLAQKLYHEEESLRAELINSKVTPEERRAALASRAKALWEAREAERQAEASALLERHFRENSDVLRHEFSKKSLQHTLEVRARQVEDCTRRRIAALREDAAWAESEAFEGFKAEMAGVAEARKRADDKHEVERTLDAQMRDNMRRRTKEAARDAEELEAVRRVQAGRDAALAKREADAAAAERALAAEIRSYNEEKIELDKQRSAEERAEERRWMDSVLAREARQLQQERDLQERQRLELKRWLEALQNSSRAEELCLQDQQEMEAMIQRYQDEQWARYDAQQQALADARAALAREVADVRARQVAAKAAQRRTETQLEMEERERMQEEAEHVARLEADARAAAQAGELRHKLDLRAKIAYNNEQKRLELEEKEQEAKLAEQQEAAYQARVKQASAYHPPTYFGRPKVQWFY